MKTTNLIAGLVLCTLLLSFTLGGDRYVVKLGDQQLVEQFVTRNAELPNVMLPPADRSKVLSIYYSECGRIGKERTLTLKNAENRTLKVWRFVDQTPHDTMEIPASELLAALTGHTNYLFYSSKEHRDGQKLVSIARAPSAAR